MIQNTRNLPSLFIGNEIQKLFRLVLILICVACLSSLAAGSDEGQDDAESFQRKIYVPFDSLDVLLDGNSNRVLMTREEYKKLLESARQREIEKAPFDSAVVSAKYEGVVEGVVARIRGELMIETLNAGLVEVQLPFSGVAIRNAMLGDEPAKLWRNDKGKLVLLTDGEIREKLVFDLLLPMETTAARQSMTLQLPAPSATSFELAVPGNVEVKSGIPVAQRVYDKDADQTRFDLLPSRAPMNIVMSLNNRLLKDDQVVVSRSVVIHKLASYEQEIYVTCSVDVVHGALEELAFEIPQGFQVRDVATELLSQWEVVEGDAGPSDRLLVRLRQPTREDIILNLTATRNESAVGDWSAATIRPLDVAGSVSVVGVLADSALDASNVQSEGLIPIDHEFLLAAVPPGVKKRSKTGNPIQVVSAFYAPQTDYRLTAVVKKPASELTIRSNSRLLIGDRQLLLQGGLALLSKNESRFDIRLNLPEGWRLTQVSNVENQQLPFDRLDDTESTFRIKLPKRIPDDTFLKVFFRATYVPNGWLDRWEQTQVEFPFVVVDGQTQHTGAIAVSTNDDLTIRPNESAGVELLDDAGKRKFELTQNEAPLAYQFENREASLSLDVKRIDPTVTARSYNFFRVRPNQLDSHFELFFDVKQAREDEFEIELPLSTPNSIRVSSPNSKLKDYYSRDTDTSRIWTVLLAQPKTGTTRLQFDFQTPVDSEQLESLTLKPIVARNVGFQSSMFAIEGDAELDVEIETSARSIDVGELSEASYQPGRHTLGAFAWPSEQTSIEVSAERRAVYRLPAAIVQRAEMVTAISPDGKSHSAARFLLVTKQQPFLRIELPQNAKLWSVQLDGQAAKPQRDGNALLVSLVGNKKGALRDLQLVFESNFDSFNFVGTIQTFAPRLFLNESTTETGEPVPLVDLDWQLMLPDGFVVSRGDSAFQSNELMDNPSPIQQLGKWFVALGGGFGVTHRWQNVTAALETSAAPDGAMEALALDDVDAFSQLSLPADEKFMDESEAAIKLNKPKPLRGQSLVQDRQSTRGEAAQVWALSGLRSLDIKVTEWNNSVRFFNLGEQPQINATVVNQSRLNWIAIGFSLLIAALGVLLVRRTLKTKAAFVIVVLLAVSLIPVAGASFDALSTIVDLAVLAAIFAAVFFVGYGILKLMKRSFVRVTAVFSLVFIACTLSCVIQPLPAQQVVNNANDLKRILEGLRSETDVTLPADAIIIPFDPEDPDGRQNAERMLLPYEHYLTLIKKSEAAPGTEEVVSPVGYVLASTKYQTRLALDDDISIAGEIVIELLTDKPVSIALPLIGGALSDATVDGQPAKLQFTTASTADDNQQKSQQGRGASSIINLHLEGRGTKVFKFNVRIKPDRQGGWRSINARLPVGLTRGLTLEPLGQPTDIRLSADEDRRAIEADPGQSIQTVINQNGNLRLQWKPTTETQTIDRSLTANSEAVFDVREDGLRLNWFTRLEFRGSERDVFVLGLPSGYLVEDVEGENIRSWNVKRDRKGNDGRALPDQLTISLLGVAKNRESFTVKLSKRQFAVVGDLQKLDTPYLTVEGAALHQGVYTIRRSPIIQLKTLSQRAVNRIESDSIQRNVSLEKVDQDASPLGVVSFQDLKFVATPFQIGLSVAQVPRVVDADTQAVLRIGQSEADMELKVNVDVGKRPIFNLKMELPVDAEIRQLTAGLGEDWNIETVDGVQRVDIHFPSGVKGKFAILLEAEFKSFAGGEQWAIPKINVLGTQKQTGQIAVQVDPAISVTTTDLQNCESVLLHQIESWLNNEQRAKTRLALRTRGNDYDATLKFTRVQPRVTAESVTNVRTTRFAIEETILLDFDIQQAGVRVIEFELPKDMRDARVVAKLLSDIRITDVPDNAEVVRFTLELQDEVIDSYRVVVEKDRQLNDGSQRVPIPRILTGSTERRYATLQNSGRDEIETLASDDFQLLNRQLAAFGRLRQKLSGGELTMAYVAQTDQEWPEIQFELRQREALETVAASIEFAKTTMVVDSGGAYRALQNFQVNNRSEQYLDIELPEGSQLLTVVVEGRPVKPVAWPDGNDRKIRVPLIKTPIGDLDYPVQLKYAGQLGRLDRFGEIDFPVIESLNINVQLSQLHLRLPESHQWVNFAGTMTKVNRQGELEEGFLAYKSRQIQQLAEQLQNAELGLGSKKRMFENLKQLELDMERFESVRSGSDKSGQVKQLLKFNNEAIQKAQEYYQTDQAQTSNQVLDNRANLNLFLEQQSARIARNSVTKGRAGQNFDFGDLQSPAPNAQPQQVEEANAKLADLDGKKEFDSKWLDRNKLNAIQMEDGESKDELGKQVFLGAVIPQKKAVEFNPSIAFANPVLANDQPGQQQAQVRQRGVELRSRIAGQLPNEQALGGVASGEDQRLGMRFGREASESPTPFQRGGGGRGPGGGGGGFGAGGGGNANQPSFGIASQPTSEISGEQDRGGAMVQAALTSLDIELPSRGKDFFFKSPRGKASVSVTPIQTRTVSRWSSVVITVVVCISIWLACLLVLWMQKRTFMQVVGFSFLALAGLVSIATGQLPIYGLIAMVGALALFLDWITKRLIQSQRFSRVN